MNMDMDDLKDEILSHLAEMSNLSVGKPTEQSVGYGKDAEGITIWKIFEDKEKAKDSDWIEKETVGNQLGEIILEKETKLYFIPGFKPVSDLDTFSMEHHRHRGEKMLLADLVAPDSFDEAVKKLRHALNVLNICKPPKGNGLFGSMTLPPGMFPGMP